MDGPITMESRFIVFEGIDGSGKSTQARLLQRHLEERGVPSVMMAEPSGGPWGRKIREILNGAALPPAEEMNRLFIEDRRDDVAANVLPALRGGVSVIMDRYYYSNAAYQGAMGMEPREIINRNRAMGFPEPHRVYCIDISAGMALERIAARNGAGKREIFEKREFLERVREIYLSFRGGNFLVIDGSGAMEEVFRAVRTDADALSMAGAGCDEPPAGIKEK